jgi:hypothetical protein
MLIVPIGLTAAWIFSLGQRQDKFTFFRHFNSYKSPHYRVEMKPKILTQSASGSGIFFVNG